MAKDMDLENCIFLTKVHIQDNSIMVKPKASADYSILTVISMLEIGKMIKLMVLESICQQIKLCLKGSGRTIKEMDLVNKYGKMVQYFRVNTSIIKRMEKANLDGLMETSMWDNSKIIINMGKV